MIHFELASGTQTKTQLWASGQTRLANTSHLRKPWDFCWNQIELTIWFPLQLLTNWFWFTGVLGGIVCQQPWNRAFRAQLMIYDGLLWLEMADAFQHLSAPRTLVFPQIRSGATADPDGPTGRIRKVGWVWSLDASKKDVTIHFFHHLLERFGAVRPNPFNGCCVSGAISAPLPASRIQTLCGYTFKPQIFEVHRTTDQPIKTGQVQAWLVPRDSHVRGSLVGSCWLYSLNIGNKTRGTKNLGSSPRKGPKKWQDFASLTEHEAIWSTVLYPVSCPAGTTSSPNKI